MNIYIRSKFNLFKPNRSSCREMLGEIISLLKSSNSKQTDQIIGLINKVAKQWTSKGTNV